MKSSAPIYCMLKFKNGIYCVDVNNVSNISIRFDKDKYIGHVDISLDRTATRQ